MLMADQTINIGLNVNSNGTTDQEIKKAGQLNSALKTVQNTAKNTAAFKSAEAASSGAAGDSNFARGVSGQTGAAGRDFAAQAQGLGGLVHVYATFAANIFAVSAAFTALSKAADFELMIKGMDQIGAASGKNLGTMANRLREITDGAISMKAALTATAQSNAAGISADQLSRLAAVASTASHVLGRDLEESLSRLIRGVTKSQPELLDELGIIVHVGKAAAEYAQQLGKSVTALTQFEKSQSFVIATIKQGEAKFKDVTIAANPYSKLLAEVTNTAYAAGAAFNSILGPIAKFLGESPTALVTVLSGLVGLLISKAIPALGQWQEALAKTAIKSAETARIARDSYQDFLISKDLGPGMAMQRQAEIHKAAVRQIAEQNKGLISDSSKLGVKLYDNDTTANFNKSDVMSTKSAATTATKAAAAAQLEYNNLVAKGDLVDIEVSKRKLAQLYAERDLRVQIAAEVRLGAFAAQEAAKLGDIAEDNANKKPGYFSKEAVDGRILARKELAATKAQIIFAASETSKNEGFLNGFSKLREDIKNAGPELSKFQGGMLTITGTAKMAASSVLSIASSLSNVFMVVGIVIAAFGVLDSLFSKNAKALADYANGIKVLEDAADGAIRTIDFYAKNSEKRFSSEGIIAYATSFNELNSAVEKTSLTLDKVKNILSGPITGNTWWEKLKDEVNSLFGGGIQKNAAEALAKSLYEGVKLAAGGPQAAAMQKLIAENIAPKSISVEGIEKALNKLKPEEFAAKFATISKALEKVNRDLNNTASDLKEFNDAMKAATDSQDKYLQSLSNADPLFKFGAALEAAAAKLTKALQEPQNALTAIIELSKDFDKLSLLPKDSALQLVKAKTELSEIQTLIALSQKNLATASEEAAKAKEKMGNAPTYTGRGGAVKSTQANAAEQEYADARMRVRGIQAELETRTKLSTDIINRQGNIALQLLEAGAAKINDSLKRAIETANIELAKTAISGLSGSGTAEANAILAKQEIDIQVKLVQAQLNSISSQEDLRVAINDLELTTKLAAEQAKGDKADKSKIESYTKQQTANASFTTITGAGATKATIDAKLKELTDKLQVENIDLIGRLITFNQRRATGESQLAVLGAKRQGVDITAAKGSSKETSDQELRSLKFAEQEQNIRLDTVGTLRSYSPIFNQILSDETELIVKARDKNALEQKTVELKEIQRQMAITVQGLSGQEAVAALAKKGYTEQESNKLREISILKKQQFETEIARIQILVQARLDSINLIKDLENRVQAGKDAVEQAKLDVQKNSLEILKNYGTIDEATYVKEKSNLDLISDKIAFNASLRALEVTQAKELAAQEGKIAAAKERVNRMTGPLNGNSAEEEALKSAENVKALTLAAQSSEKTALEANYEAKQKIIAANNVIAQQTAQYNDLLKVQTGILESLTGAFGNFGTAVGGVLAAMTEGFKRNQDLTSGYAEQLKKFAAEKAALDEAQGPGENDKKIADEKIKLAEKVAAAELKFNNDIAINENATIAKSAASMKKNFSEKTAAFKVLDAVEKAAHTAKLVRQGIEFAMIAKEMIMNALKTSSIVSGAAAEATANTAALAPKAADMVASGGQAILSQGKGDPYTAFARMAAMAAFVASILAAFGGGGKSVSMTGASQKEIDAVTAENVQKTQNTGGVLGDSTATSKSIKNGIDELTKNSFDQLDFTQSMLKSLQNIDKGISAFGVAIARATGIQGVGPSKFGTSDGSSTTSAGGNWLFGKKSTTVQTDILDTGVRLTGTIGDFLKGLGKIIQYEKDLITTTTSKSGFLGFGGGTTTNREIKEQTSTLEDSTQKLVSKIITGMTVSISEAFKLLQLPTANLIDLLSGIDVTGLAASLKGLSGQDASDAIDAFFANIFDTMASKVAPWVGEFQKVGESMGDTLVRIASDTRTVNYAFLTLGVATKDAGKAAEEAGVSIEEWVLAQTRANENLIDLVGGIEEFASKMDFIAQNFLTETQKLAPVRKALIETFSATGNLGKELAKVGLATPKTRAEFVTLLTTLHDMGDAGNAASAALLDVAPAFDKIQGAAEDMIVSIGERISDLEFQMTLDTLDTQGKYALINKTAGEDYEKYMAAVNDKAVSAVDAAKLANKLIDRIQQGWNLLSTEQRQEAGVRAKYFADLDEINASIIAKGGAELIGLSDDTIAQVSAIDTSTDRIVAAITNSAVDNAVQITDPINQVVEANNTQGKLLQVSFRALELTNDAIAKALNSSANSVYGNSTQLSAYDVQNLVDATVAAPQQFASAVAANPLVIPPIDISGIQTTVTDLKDTVANMLLVLTQRAAEPVNLNVNVQAPRNQEVGVSMA